MFATVRPAAGNRFALVMPVVSTEAMTMFLTQFNRGLAADEHAVMVLDQDSWHGARDLRVLDNVTLLPLPRYSPQLDRSSGYGFTCVSDISLSACSNTLAKFRSPDQITASTGLSEDV